MPLVKPVTVMGLAAPDLVMPPGFDVTVYEVMGLPPSDAGGVKLTVACAFPAVALTPVGAPGRPRGVTLFEGFDAGPVPFALIAFTVKV